MRLITAILLLLHGMRTEKTPGDGGKAGNSRGLQNSTALGGADGVTSISPPTLLIPPAPLLKQAPDLGAKDAVRQQQHEHRHHRIAERLVKRSDPPSDLPYIVTRGQTYRVEAGATARLSCTVHRLGKFVVMWKEASRVISAGSLLVRKDARFGLKLTRGNSFDLEINQVRVGDGGEYRCEVDIMGRPLSIVHTLEVMVAPQVAAKEGVVRLRAGQDYTLRCSAHGQPNPRIMWTKTVGGLSSVSGLSLPLGPVTRLSAGEYTCTATNGVGRPASATVIVEVEASPEVTMDQQWRSAADGAVQVKIDCTVHSNPPSQVTWFKDSGKIFETDRALMTVKGSTWALKLSELQPADFGNYSCRAENPLGRARAHTSITGRPAALVFTSPSLNHNLAHYELTWRTESFVPVTAYKLRFRLAKVDNSSTGHSTDWSEVAVPVPRTTSTVSAFSSTWSYTFPFLESGTVYDVIGLAKNKYGWGPPSSTFTFYNKGVDYSTQQIKYKEPKVEKEVKEVEETPDSGFQEKPLVMDRSSSASSARILHPFFVFILQLANPLWFH